MYKQEKPELEEYLLGRKIDKHVDEDANKETDSSKYEYDYTSVMFVTHK